MARLDVPAGAPGAVAGPDGRRHAPDPDRPSWGILGLLLVLAGCASIPKRAAVADGLVRRYADGVQESIVTYYEPRLSGEYLATIHWEPICPCWVVVFSRRVLVGPKGGRYGLRRVSAHEACHIFHHADLLKSGGYDMLTSDQRAHEEGVADRCAAAMVTR